MPAGAGQCAGCDDSIMLPLRLPANQPPQFYAGGAAIAELRGEPAPRDNRPEDWVASVTPRLGSTTDGLTRLPDGGPLREAITADPEAWLGAEHAALLGDDPYLLVKLLDAGERLPVHVHPDRRFAGEHLGLHHGKTEAWIVLAADGADAAVHLGFRTDVTAAELRGWVAEQDTAALRGALHRLDVAPGDTVLVPAGTPHAIGAGILCVELQEPTDLSIMLETAGFPLGGDSVHLGLGYDRALQCVRREALGPDELERLWRRDAPELHRGRAALFGPEADPFFRAERVSAPAVLPAAFAVLVVVGGSGTLRTEQGEVLPVGRGDTLLVPHAAGALRLDGAVELVRCLPPEPAAVAAG